MFARLTGSQVLAVLPSSGVEPQAGDYKAVNIEADYTANTTASMIGRAYQWTAAALTEAGFSLITITGEDLVNANRIHAYRVILDCLENTRMLTRYEGDKCEPLEIYKSKVRAIRDQLCQACSALGIVDNENCFSITSFMGAEQINTCNHD